MLVNLIFTSFLLSDVRGPGGFVCCSSSPSPVFCALMIYPCGRGAVREHPRERTRNGGTAPARHPPPAAVQVSAGRGGAVRPLSIPQNRRRATLAGAWIRPAAACEADARSPEPTVVRRPAGSI